MLTDPLGVTTGADGKLLIVVVTASEAGDKQPLASLATTYIELASLTVNLAEPVVVVEPPTVLDQILLPAVYDELSPTEPPVHNDKLPSGIIVGLAGAEGYSDRVITLEVAEQLEVASVVLTEKE